MGDIKYPINELMKMMLTRPTIVNPANGKNGSTKGNESATAPRLYPVSVPSRKGIRITIATAGNARLLIISVISTGVPETLIISRKIIIPKIASARFQVNDFFMTPRYVLVSILRRKNKRRRLTDTPIKKHLVSERPTNFKG